MFVSKIDFKSGEIVRAILLLMSIVVLTACQTDGQGKITSKKTFYETKCDLVATSFYQNRPRSKPTGDFVPATSFDAERAVKECRKALKLYPDNTRLMVLLARGLLAKENGIEEERKEALELLRIAAEKGDIGGAGFYAATLVHSGTSDKATITRYTLQALQGWSYQTALDVALAMENDTVSDIYDFPVLRNWIDQQLLSGNAFAEILKGVCHWRSTACPRDIRTAEGLIYLARAKGSRLGALLHLCLLIEEQDAFSDQPDWYSKAINDTISGTARRSEYSRQRNSYFWLEIHGQPLFRLYEVFLDTQRFAHDKAYRTSRLSAYQAVVGPASDFRNNHGYGYFLATKYLVHELGFSGPGHQKRKLRFLKRSDDADYPRAQTVLERMQRRGAQYPELQDFSVKQPQQCSVAFLFEGTVDL